MSLVRSAHEVVVQTVEGLGYDMIELERLSGGLMRVTIDFPYIALGQPQSQSEESVSPERLITVEDCERVTRQLQYVLEVEEVAYERLEVASPGIDRPLRHELDFQRFLGETIDVTLKESMELFVGGVLAGKRKKFRGILEVAEQVDAKTEVSGAQSALAASEADLAKPLWQILWTDAPAPKPGVRVSAKRKEVIYQALCFSLDEIKEARLAPIVDFKGRRSKQAQ